MSWVVLARLGRAWRVFWLSFGALGGVLEGSWSHFGGSWEGLGRVLGTIWGAFGGSAGHFSRFFVILMDFVRIVKNIEKTMVFHCFLMF